MGPRRRARTYLDVAVGVQHDVVKLQHRHGRHLGTFLFSDAAAHLKIPIGYLPSVQEAQPACDFSRVEAGAVLLEATRVLDVEEKVAAGNVLHDIPQVGLVVQGRKQGHHC